MEKIAYMGDIESMFYQVRVPSEQQTFLKFLWWPEGNFNKAPQDYQMCVHLFGATSSPSCSNFALRQTVIDNESQDTTEGETILNNFYVDDMLKSSDDTQSAIETVSNVQKLCSSGGFNLTKFVCGESEVMESIPLEKRSSKVVKEISKTETIERALGVHWCLETDTFGFRISLQDTPLTRRGILSTISSIYDPLGIAGPFLLKGKKILQLITSLKDGWDCKVPEYLAHQWISWRDQLFQLQHVTLERCYKPATFGPVQRTSLHIFSDASEIGYGAVCYLRQVDTDDNICVSLVLGKSRVSPIKPITIPRMELTAATVSVKLGAMLKKELNLPNLHDYYWTDSKIVLEYIFNDVKRFRVFVANRTQKIRSYTKKVQWNYIETKENPADHASRGITIDDSHQVRQWLYGPDYLHEKEESWTTSSCQDIALDEKDVEVKPSISVHTIKVDESNHIIRQLEERVSSWEKMIRIVNIMVSFSKRCRMRKNKRKTFSPSVADLQHAEYIILTAVQNTYLGKELEFYRKINPKNQAESCKKYRQKENHLYKLDPFIGEDGIMRVGGRLNKSSLSEATKNPIILPKNSKISIRIAECCHQKVKHSGRTSTLNEIRQRGFWLINSNTIVRSIIHHCVRCKELRGILGQQKMADLPKERCSTEGPFTYNGLDMFGPFYIKEGRKEIKRFVALFTCLSSRAIHLETTNSLETDSFIQALRRFVSRRGKVREIISDNGNNFVGTKNEWKRAFKEMDHERISSFLLSQSCDWIDWKRNPPLASHMGGVWERQIRSVRNVLSSLLRDHSSNINDESLRTLLTEAECIVNSRPLTVENLQDPTSLPLSPNTLLTMKSKVVLPPPGVFQKEDMFCRKRWRQVQYLANEFWVRWRKEFLHNLQVRQPHKPFPYPRRIDIYSIL